jgi:ParB family transcriptional regulator, chromosome partitioning protein
MAEFKRIPIAQIAIPERLRAVEEEHALAIAQSIVEHGLLNPITVRATPAANKGVTPFTLVAGAHRLRGVELNEESEIDALVIEADRQEAQLVEIVENIFRNELSVMDRAIFVQSYREIWEAKHGKIEAGRPGNCANLAQFISDEAEAGSFSLHVAERMGFSRRKIERLNSIAQNLTPKLREQLRGTPAADNQSLLLGLSKRQPTEQAKIATAMGGGASLPDVLTALQPTKAKTDDRKPQEIAKADLIVAWRRADSGTRAFFLLDALIDAGVDVELATKVKDALMRSGR